MFELADAVLCTEGSVRTLVKLALAPEYRRGHGALYDGLNRGDVDLARLRRVVSALPLPRTASGVLDAYCALQLAPSRLVEVR